MSFQFPPEIKDLITSLHDDTKWKILELLINNQNKLSYTQIKTGLGIDESKGPLNYHLKELQKSGWVRNWVDDVNEMSDNQKSFYAISNFGLKVVEGIMKAMDMAAYQQDPLQQITEMHGSASAFVDLTNTYFNEFSARISAINIYSAVNAQAVSLEGASFLESYTDGTALVMTKRRSRRM